MRRIPGALIVASEAAAKKYTFRTPPRFARPSRDSGAARAPSVRSPPANQDQYGMISA